MLKYYYIDDISKLQCGPFLPNELERKGIRPETMVWRSGMQDWVEAGTLPELAYLFDPKIPAPKEQEKTSSTINTPQQGVKPNNQNTDIPPKTWMVEAVIFTFICCSPISLVGLYFSSRVETLYYTKRDYVAAEKASNRAKMWGLGGILFWPVIYVVYSLIRFGTLSFY